MCVSQNMAKGRLILKYLGTSRDLSLLDWALAVLVGLFCDGLAFPTDVSMFLPLILCILAPPV